VAAAVALAGLAATVSATATAKTEKTWVLELATRYFPPPSSHSEYTNVLVAGRTSWFFGGSNFAGRGRPVIEARSKRRWITSTLPSGLHTWIAGASAASPDDIWAVTYLGGTVLHWTGADWATAGKGGWNDKARFTGIQAFSPRNVWLFGARGTIRKGAGTWHLSGTKWTEVRGMAADIDQASAVSSTDMWGFGGIRGFNNALFRFRNGIWLHETPANLAGFSYSYVLAISPTDVWVAGSVSGSPELGHYNGRGWAALAVPALVPVSGMCRDGRGGLWLIANSGRGPSYVIDRSANGTFTTVPVGRTSWSEVLACALLPRTNSAWGAGKAPAPGGSAAAVYAYGKTP
jgi:hypothetical protein